MEADEIVYRALVARARAAVFSESLEAMEQCLRSLDEHGAAETLATQNDWWCMHGLQMHAFLAEDEVNLSVSMLDALMPDAALLMAQPAGNA